MTDDPLYNDELLSLADAAEYSGLDSDYLRQLIHKGRLRARKFGSAWVTSRTAMDEYLQGRSRIGRKPKSQKKKEGF